jgi:hypothetical protein
VVRQFEIIGEALGQALRVDSSLADAVTDTGRIIAFRNRLIHGYASVSDAVVRGRPTAVAQAEFGSMIPGWSGSSGGTAGSADAAECD